MDAIVYDEITTQIGKKTDPASDTGSLHAKIADVKNQCDVTVGSRSAARKSVIGSGYCDNTTGYMVLLSVAGKGTLKSLMLYGDTNTHGGGVRVTIDGVVVFTMGKSGMTTSWWFHSDGLIDTPFNLDYEFQSTLLIEGTKQSFTGSNGTIATWHYAKQ